MRRYAWLADKLRNISAARIFLVSLSDSTTVFCYKLFREINLARTILW